MKKLLLLVTTCFTLLLNAEIIQTINVADALPYIKEDTLVLFDMDDTLTDSSITLGSGNWRRYIREKIPVFEKKHGKKSEFNLHDLLTFYVAKKVPAKAVEADTPRIIAELQAKGQPVYVFTARSRAEWYSTHLEKTDQFTIHQLNGIGADFSLSAIPDELQSFDSTYFWNGIFFSTHIKKGPFLKNLLQKTGFRPSSIVFFDDYEDQVQSVQKELKDSGIPYLGVWYRRADADHHDFDPIETTIQLKELLSTGRILSDIEAKEIKASMDVTDGDAFFFEFLEALDVSALIEEFYFDGLSAYSP